MPGDENENPTDDKTTPAPPSAPSTSRGYTRGKLIALAAAVLVAVAVGITLAVTLTGSSGSGSGMRLTMSGQIVVAGNGGGSAYNGLACPTDNLGLNADITVGTEIVAYSDSGKIVGQGPILSSKSQRNPQGSPVYDCAYRFAIANLPASPFYQIEIAGHGKVTVNKADVANVILTIGG